MSVKAIMQGKKDNTKLDKDGVAAAAEKLSIPRTIELSGAVTGSAEFDGSGNISISAITRRSVVSSTSNPGSNTWHKFASTIISGTSFNYTAHFLVCGSNSDIFGILNLNVRTTTGNKVNAIQFSWKIASNVINPDNFVCAYSNDNNPIVELWVNITQSYGGYKFILIDENKVWNINSDQNVWTIYNDINTQGETSPTEGYTQVPSTYRNLKTGEIFTQAETPSAGNSLVSKDYADAVPYQYAKAAGFRYNESEFKTNLYYMPARFYKQYSGSDTRHIGYKKLASVKNNVVSGTTLGMLHIEGRISEFSNTCYFHIIIPVRNPSDNLRIRLDGFGSDGMSNKVNIVVTSNQDNNIQSAVYLEKLQSDYQFEIVDIAVWEGNTKQWDIEDLSDTTLTSGTIPGTKVWDLKTAWGNTSRTQITKEEADEHYLNKRSPLLAAGNDGYSTSLFFQLGQAELNHKARIIGNYLSETNEANFYFQLVDASGNHSDKVSLTGLRDASTQNGAVTLRQLNRAISALEAKLTGKTVAEVMAANAIPNEAPTLEEEII